MNNKTIIAIVAAVIIVIGGGLILAGGNKKDSSTNSSTPAASSSSTPSTPSTTPSTPSTATATSFTINANDESADKTTLDVKSGDSITVTFKVDTDNVYHGGLEFKSDVVNSKPITPGSSDTVTFTASKSFDFTPYWYQSSIKKDYLIHVNVT